MMAWWVSLSLLEASALGISGTGGFLERGETDVSWICVASVNTPNRQAVRRRSYVGNPREGHADAGLPCFYDISQAWCPHLAWGV
jgi:hypothetical protein